MVSNYPSLELEEAFPLPTCRGDTTSPWGTALLRSQFPRFSLRFSPTNQGLLVFSWATSQAFYQVFSPFLSNQTEISVFPTSSSSLAPLAFLRLISEALTSVLGVESIRMQMVSRPRRLARCKDRISALPDALLCHILSFLRTTFAVRTTVLSKRWKNVWTSLPNLHFHALDDFSDTDGFRSFTTFVDRVLFFRDSADIKTLSLELIEVDRDVVSRVGDWLCTAAWRNVVVVYLYLHLFLHDDLRDCKEWSLEFPQSLFTCKTLARLIVSSNCMNYNPPTSGCFPRLKTLHVEHLYPDDEDSTENLFSYCPVLESLTIDGLISSFDNHRAHNFCISVPSLQSLKISLDTCNLYSRAGYNFAIDCPKLKNLHIRMDEDYANFSLGCTKCLVRANIDLIEYPENEGEEEEDGRPPFVTRATALLALLLEVRYLSLHIHCFEDSRLPNFFKLKQMNLVLHECNYWDVLLHLLMRTPYLKHLVFEASRKCCRPSLHGNRGKEISEEEYSELQWSTPKGMPGCLLLKLKTITIKEFKGRRDEMEVVKYLLKKSSVLDRMTIYIRKMSDGLPYVEEKVLLKKLLWFERGSKTCRVEIFN